MLDIIVEDKYELKNAALDLIGEHGTNADLNCIDTSRVDDMSFLFNGIDFNGDISKWDTSNVGDMHKMFCRSTFNGDISKWDVSNVYDFSYMFYNSDFKQDVSDWNVISADNMKCMFGRTLLKTDINRLNIPFGCNIDDIIVGCHIKLAMNEKAKDKFKLKYKWRSNLPSGALTL